MRRALAISALSLCSGFPAAAAMAAEPPKADPAKGQTTASQVCAACHGADGNSPAPVNPNLAGQVPEYLQKQLQNFKAAPGKKPERDSAIMVGMVANL